MKTCPSLVQVKDEENALEGACAKRRKSSPGHRKGKAGCGVGKLVPTHVPVSPIWQRPMCDVYNMQRRRRARRGSTLTSAVLPEGNSLVSLDKVWAFETEFVLKFCLWKLASDEAKRDSQGHSRQKYRCRHVGK